MKIVFNCLTLEKGGAERVITTLCNNLISNYDITIIKTKVGNSAYELNEKICVKTIDSRKYNNNSKLQKLLSRIDLKRFIKMRNLIVAEKPDIIISFLPEPSIRLMILKLLNKKLRKTKTIISIRNDPNTEYKNKLLRLIVKKLYTKVDGLVLQTNDAMLFFEGSIKKNKMKVIPNPINDIFLVSSPYKNTRKKEIVTVGRLENQKNQKLLIDSFIEFRKKHDDYVLKIYGEGRLKEELQSYINTKKTGKFIFLMGISNNIKDEIYKSECFVLSSNYEGMPNALMEAMALGIPCISTNCPCGGPKELIDNNENGFLFEVNDKKALTNLMNYVVENKKEMEEVSLKANKKMKKYSCDKITKEWDLYINEIVGDKL